MGIKLSTASDPELYNKKTNESSEIYSKYPESPEDPLTHDESRKDQFPFEMATDGPHEIMSNESQPISELRERLGRKSTVKFNMRRHVTISRDPVEDSYDLKEELGSGGYGTVYKVVHRLTGQERAMKSIPKDSYCKNKEPDINEVNVLKELSHPHIIKIHDIIVTRKYNVIMELVTGDNLLNFMIKHRKNLSEEDIAKWMYNILSGVSYCHSRNVIHMDIKPDNIMFQDDSPDSILKIIDFGLSIFTSAIAKPTMGNGSIDYKAPEVFDGIFSAKADIWSCGVLLYWLLSGSLPFSGKTEKSTINFIRNGDLIFQNEEWNSITDQAKDLVKLMLTKDPDKRITAKEAFNHPWIQRYSNSHLIDHNLMFDTFSQLITFNPYIPVRHAALEYISTHFTIAKDITMLQKAFLAADKDNNGALSKDELSDMVSKLELSTKTNIEELIENLDADQNGLVDFTEFSTGAIDWGKNMSKSKCEATFRAFDIDKDGVIDINELKKALGDNQMLDEETWANILSQADFNNDGKIQFSEFEMTCTTTYLNQGTKRMNLKFPRNFGNSL